MKKIIYLMICAGNVFAVLNAPVQTTLTNLLATFAVIMFGLAIFYAIDELKEKS